MDNEFYYLSLTVPQLIERAKAHYEKAADLYSRDKFALGARFKNKAVTEALIARGLMAISDDPEMMGAYIGGISQIL